MITRFWIDSKQPKEFQYNLTRAFPEAQVKNLGTSSGDLLIQVDHKLVVAEVKEFPADFIASVTDKRLFRQAEGIRALTPWAFLILSSDPCYNDDGVLVGRGPNGYGPIEGWTRDHIDGALTAVQMRGVVVRVAYLGYTACIRRIVDWVEHADEGEVTREVFKLSPLDEYSQSAVNLLTLFPNVGLTKAKNFLKWSGPRPLYEILQLAVTEFGEFEKPIGWTNKQIQTNRAFMGYPKVEKPAKTEWVEELDL